MENFNSLFVAVLVTYLADNATASESCPICPLTLLAGDIINAVL